MDCFKLLIFIYTVVTVFAISNADDEDSSSYVVQLKGPNGAFCTGTVIDNKSVLTLPKCIVDLTTGNVLQENLPLTVVTKSESREVEAFIHVKHSAQPYYKSYGSDIIVLKLKSGLDNSAKVKLPEVSDIETYEGKIASELGYVNRNEESGNISHVLGKQSTSIISNKECRVKIEAIRDYHLCGYHRDPKINFSVGSGSPLTYDDTLIGIQFIGRTYDDFPVVFMRISSYLEFLNNAIKENYTNDMIVTKL